MEKLKNYLLVTIEKRYIRPSGFSCGGHYNEHFIECQYQTRKSCEDYQNRKNMWHSVILTRRQYELSVETTGLHTII